MYWTWEHLRMANDSWLLLQSSIIISNNNSNNRRVHIRPGNIEHRCVPLPRLFSFIILSGQLKRAGSGWSGGLTISSQRKLSSSWSSWSFWMTYEYPMNLESIHECKWMSIFNECTYMSHEPMSLWADPGLLRKTLKNMNWTNQWKWPCATVNHVT